MQMNKIWSFGKPQYAIYIWMYANNEQLWCNTNTFNFDLQWLKLHQLMGYCCCYTVAPTAGIFMTRGRWCDFYTCCLGGLHQSFFVTSFIKLITYQPTLPHYDMSSYTICHIIYRFSSIIICYTVLQIVTLYYLDWAACMRFRGTKCQLLTLFFAKP